MPSIFDFFLSISLITFFLKIYLNCSLISPNELPVLLVADFTSLYIIFRFSPSNRLELTDLFFTSLFIFWFNYNFSVDCIYWFTTLLGEINWLIVSIYLFDVVLLVLNCCRFTNWLFNFVIISLLFVFYNYSFFTSPSLFVSLMISTFICRTLFFEFSLFTFLWGVNFSKGDLASWLWVSYF